VNNGMARLSVISAYHNFIKAYKVDNYPLKHPTHGKTAGIPDYLMQILMKNIFRYRYFYTHSPGITGSMKKLWFGMLETPMKVNRMYRQKYLAL